MKALTDKIIERLKELSETCYPGMEFGKGLTEAAHIIEQYERDAEFEEVARQLMKHMAEKYHPHHSAIVTSINAELLEGEKSTGETMEYIPD